MITCMAEVADAAKIELNFFLILPAVKLKAHTFIFASIS